MKHQQVHDAAVEYARDLHLPPEYVHDAESAFIAGSDWATTEQILLMQNKDKRYSQYEPGSIEATIHSHVNSYIEGVQDIGELIYHLRRILAPPRDDEDQKQQEKAAEIKLPWKQLSLFD